MVRHNGNAMTTPDASTDAETGADDRGWLATFLLLPKPMRLTAYVALGLAGALVVSLLMVVVLVRQPLPQTDGNLDLPGLESTVNVVRDEHGIPQLYGDSVADLMRAQG